MKKSRAGFALLIAFAIFMGISFVSPTRGFAEEGRKVKFRVKPVYPDMARQQAIVGTVKVEAVVTPNGDVKSTRIIGGHPLLGNAAQEALRKWKYEPTGETSTVVVQFEFSSGS